MDNRDSIPLEKPVNGTSITVLYVDDDLDYTQVTKGFLDDLFGGSIIVHTLNDPLEVIKELNRNVYDILVSDFSMNGMNGLELLEKVREEKIDLPFVIFTGKSREEIAIQALNLGADYYIKKGGDPDSQYRELGHVIQRVVNYSRTVERLQESEDRLGHLMSQNLLGMIILQGGRIKFANQAVTSITGYTTEEMLLWSPEEFVNFVHPGDRQFVVEQARKFQSGDSSAIKHYSFKAIAKNGKIKYLDKYSETIDHEGSPADLASLIDTTDRVIRSKAIEEIFLESEERYRSLVEMMSEGLLIQDKDNVITYVNDAMCKMFLYSKNEIMGSSTSNFLDEESRKIFTNRAQRTYSSSNKKYELTGIRKDGSKIKVYVSPRAILGKKGRFKGSFAIVTDISSLKKTEETLSKSEEKYRKLNDLSKRVEEELRVQKEELKDFADFIAHDVTNHLTTLIGYIKLMERKEDLSYLNKIEKQARYMQQQLNSSLKLAKSGRVIENKELVDINDLIDRVAEITIPKHIVFQRDDFSRLPCDLDKISQVFANLLENAVIHGKPSNIQIKNKEERNGIRISVLNDGIPINPEARDYLFKKESRSYNKHSGLGMVIVKKIIEAHGWEIQLLPDTGLTILEISIPH